MLTSTPDFKSNKPNEMKIDPHLALDLCAITTIITEIYFENAQFGWQILF